MKTEATLDKESQQSTDTFNELYEHYHGRLKTFVSTRVRNEADARDLVQDVFFKIHSCISTLTDNSKVENWIFQIARNSVIDHYRLKKHFQEIDESVLLQDVMVEDPAPEQLAPAIQEFIVHLPDPYREALLLTECRGLSRKELAKRLNLSSSGAKSRVLRGRKMIKQMLMRCCHFEFDSYGTLVDYHEISCCCCQEYDRSPSEKPR
jgi:RNA polymerase sigma-70 factor (ECF subfamily)